jgi:hypothetical protein
MVRVAYSNGQVFDGSVAVQGAHKPAEYRRNAEQQEQQRSIGPKPATFSKKYASEAPAGFCNAKLL